MRVLAQQPYRFTLYEADERLILSVLVGGVAMWEVNIALTPEEIVAWQDYGLVGLMPLVDAIMATPRQFQDRQTALPG